jgi:hypothetical protein
MKKVRNKRKDAPQGRASGAMGEVELVGLERLDPEKDESEVADVAGSEPTADSPGDEALLEQEEIYEGISGDRPPSEKSKKDGSHG